MHENGTKKNKIIHLCTNFLMQCPFTCATSLWSKMELNIKVFFKSCPIGLSFHLPFSVLTPYCYCLQSLVIRDQILKT